MILGVISSKTTVCVCAGKAATCTLFSFIYFWPSRNFRDGLCFNPQCCRRRRCCRVRQISKWDNFLMLWDINLIFCMRLYYVHPLFSEKYFRNRMVRTGPTSPRWDKRPGFSAKFYSGTIEPRNALKIMVLPSIKILSTLFHHFQRYEVKKSIQ